VDGGILDKGGARERGGISGKGEEGTAEASGDISGEGGAAEAGGNISGEGGVA
jgi:hypothetical protein